jgi:polyisoprenoid-binding protein YceI
MASQGPSSTAPRPRPKSLILETEMKHMILAAAAATAAMAVACYTPFAARAADPNPAAVTPGAYAVEPLHTRVLFVVNHLGFNDYFGQFTGAAGTLTLDPKNPDASKIDVTLPLEGLTTTNAKLDGELRSPDWFDATQFPTIHFVSTAITRTGSNTAKVSGNLTLHGITRPVLLDATFNAAGPNPLTKAFTAGFSAHGRIKRSEFGVSKYVPMIGDDVNLIISAAFEKQAG